MSVAGWSSLDYGDIIKRTQLPLDLELGTTDCRTQRVQRTRTCGASRAIAGVTMVR